jgi:hypothetical protein
MQGRGLGLGLRVGVWERRAAAASVIYVARGREQPFGGGP